MNANVQPIFTPDLEAMRSHVEHLFGGYLDGCHDGLIELAWTDTKATDGKYPLKHAQLFGTDQIEELIEAASRLNSTPMCNVYIGAALRRPETPPFGRGQDSDAWALTSLYVDLDDPGTATSAKEIYGLDKPTMVVVTGRAPHTRAQMWWRLEEPLTDPAKWPNLIRGMAVKMQGDTTVTNASRVMRLAGTIAWPVKDGRTVELTSIAQLKEPGRCQYDPDHLASIFPPVAAASAQPVQINGTVHHKTNTLGLTDKIDDGRERYMLQTISACLIELIGTTGATPSPQELYDAAWPQYERKVDLTRPGRGPEEFAAKCSYTVRRFEEGRIGGVETLDKAIAAYQAKQAKKSEPARPRQAPSSYRPTGGPRFPFETVGDLRKLPAPQWLAKNWVPEGAVGIFYGKWAAGKSFIGFDFLLHLAYGFKEWHGVPLPGEPCDVLVVAREGAHGFVNRIDAFKKHHGITDDTDRIKFMRASVSFMRDEEFNGLIEAIGALGILFRCTMVDTVARAMPGTDMNEQEVVTLFMERLQILGNTTGAAAIGVHHENKSGGMMGSIYFEANADFVFEIIRHGEDDEPLTRGEIICTKQKDGEDRWKRAVSYKRVELSIVPEGPTSLIVESIGQSLATPQGSIWPDRETCRRIVNAINEAWISGRPWSFEPQSKRSGRFAPKLMNTTFQIHPKVAETMIETWLMNEILSVEMRNSDTKMKGLKVIGSL